MLEIKKEKNMYKSIINDAVERKVARDKIQRELKCKANRIKNTKYDINDIYVGYILGAIKVRTNSKIKVKHLVNPEIKMFKRVDVDKFMDIESEIRYPLISQNFDEQQKFVSGKYLTSFITYCVETLYEKEIDSECKMSIKELKSIIAEQEKLRNDMLYDI